MKERMKEISQQPWPSQLRYYDPQKRKRIEKKKHFGLCASFIYLFFMHRKYRNIFTMKKKQSNSNECPIVHGKKRG
jgi:hypothetical protein